MRFLCSLCLLLFIWMPATAQAGDGEDVAEENPERPNPWAIDGPDAAWQQPRVGIETELIWPFLPGVHTVTIKVTGALFRTQWFAGEIVGGAYIRPKIAHDVVETIEEYMGTLGWRQFLWRGLHFEALLHLGYARGTNNQIDGLDYEDVSFMTEFNVGYRFDLIKPRPVGLFLLSQGGFIGGIYTNIGPRDDVDIFPTFKFSIGISFSQDKSR